MAWKNLGGADGLVRVNVFGLMSPADQAEMQALAGEAIAKDGKARILVLLDGFAGFARGGDWEEDLTFVAEHGDDIEKMAFVGEERWKEGAFMFSGKGFRDTEIEYFPPSQRRAAEEWLSA